MVETYCWIWFLDASIVDVNERLYMRGDRPWYPVYRLAGYIPPVDLGVSRDCMAVGDKSCF